MDFVPMWPAPFQKKTYFFIKTSYFGSKMFSGPKTDFVSEKNDENQKVAHRKTVQ